MKHFAFGLIPLFLAGSVSAQSCWGLKETSATLCPKPFLSHTNDNEYMCFHQLAAVSVYTNLPIPGVVVSTLTNFADLRFEQTSYESAPEYIDTGSERLEKAGGSLDLWADFYADHMQSQGNTLGTLTQINHRLEGKTAWFLDTRNDTKRPARMTAAGLCIDGCIVLATTNVDASSTGGLEHTMFKSALSMIYPKGPI